VTRFLQAGVRALVALCAFGTGCADVSTPSEHLGPRTAPAPSLQSPESEAEFSCGAATPAERLAAMRRGVEALPPAAALAARTRMLPQIGAVGQAVGQGQQARAAEGLRAFVGEIVELRLRAPFEERLALASEAECLLHELDPAGLAGV
jgi:hypothetical protein